MIALYYSRVTLTRLTELLDLPPITTERTLCKLVTDKTIYARIDRPAGVVTFKPKTNPTDVLNSWATDIDKMLGLVEKTSHLVSKVSYCDPFRVRERTRADQSRSTLCTRQSRARRSGLRLKDVERSLQSQRRKGGGAERSRKYTEHSSSM